MAAGRSRVVDGCTRRQHDDGRLCLHATATNKTLWCSSHTARPSGEYFTRIQSDGNLCTFAGVPPPSNNAEDGGQPTASFW